MTVNHPPEYEGRMTRSPYDDGWLDGLAVELQLNHPSAVSLASGTFVSHGPNAHHEQTEAHADLRDDDGEGVTAKYERADRNDVDDEHVPNERLRGH